MKKALIGIARSTLWNLGIGAVKAQALEHLVQKAEAFDTWNPQRDHALLSSLRDGDVPLFLDTLKKSRSQLRQDLFVLCELGFKRNGFFVEFGATNGISLSNTYLLEREFGWRGVLAEPARCWHHSLTQNRAAAIDTRCVWSSSGAVVKFNEVGLGELSTIHAFSSADFHGEARKAGKTYDVATVSLNDLLDGHGAPRQVDYLSIDTEGSEFDILSSVDFDRHSFSVITCEHNYTPRREEIHALLADRGYVRKHQGVSEFDDWYVRLA